METSSVFEVLAHADFPRRNWPHHLRFEEKVFEDGYREVFRALAGSGRVLELNTRSPLWSATLLGWWRDEGGRALSFGSDAHQPQRVAPGSSAGPTSPGRPGSGQAGTRTTSGGSERGHSHSMVPGGLLVTSSVDPVDLARPRW